MDLCLQPHAIILGQNYTKPNNTLELGSWLACCKLQNRIPSLNGFVEKLHYLEKIERDTSLSRDTYFKHI